MSLPSPSQKLEILRSLKKNGPTGLLTNLLTNYSDHLSLGGDYFAHFEVENQFGDAAPVLAVLSPIAVPHFEQALNAEFQRTHSLLCRHHSRHYPSRFQFIQIPLSHYFCRHSNASKYDVINPKIFQCMRHKSEN